MSGWLCLAIPIGLAAAFMLLLLVVALVERQHVYEWGPPPPEGPVFTEYQTAMNAGAWQAGFTKEQTLRHVKHPLTATLWYSPDRTIIARVVGGTIAKAACKRTTLLTRLSNGRVLSTTDEVSIGDLTGLFARRLVMNGDFAELVDAHRADVAAAGPLVVPFAREAAVEADAIEVDVVMRQEAFGYSRFIDRDRGTYRHTLRGAVKVATRGLIGGFATAASQRDRADVPRPG